MCIGVTYMRVSPRELFDLQLYNSTAPLHDCTTAPLYDCTTAPLHDCTTAPLHHSMTAPLHHCTTPRLHHCTTTPLHHCTTSPLHHCTTADLHHCATADLHHRTIAPLHCTGVSNHCSTLKIDELTAHSQKYNILTSLGSMDMAGNPRQASARWGLQSRLQELLSVQAYPIQEGRWIMCVKNSLYPIERKKIPSRTKELICK